MEFQHKVIQLEVIAGRNNWYKHPHPHLSTLKRTGQGNCVAWSKLIQEIALKFKLIPIMIVISELDEEEDTPWHQFCVIIDNDNTVWFQNCRLLKKFRKIQFPITRTKLRSVITQIAQIVGKKTGYKKGAEVQEIIDHPFDT